MKIIKTVSSIIICAVVLTASVIFCSAAGSTSVAVSKTSANKGDTITVTVTMSANEAMYSSQMRLNYNSGIFQYVSGDSDSGGAGTVNIVPTPGGKQSVSATITFTAIGSGSGSFSVSDCYYVGISEQMTGVSASSATVSVADATQSNNANLTSLRLNGGSLSPAFSPNVTSYTATVPNNITSGRLYANTADPAATVSVEGSSNLKEGQNVRTVVVTAPGGAVKRYTVTIIRQGADESSLEESTASEEENNPLEVTINGAAATIITDTSVLTVPTGFNGIKTQYNGVEVPVAQDNNYTIYFVKTAESETPVLCVLKDGAFEPIKYLNANNKFYIFEADGKSVPDGYRTAETEIGGFTVEGYASNDSVFNGYYFVYCYVSGQRDYYRYDSSDNTIQREPDFTSGKALAVNMHEDPQIEEDENNGFFARFSSLSTNAKITVILIAAAIIAAIALIVLLIIKAVSHKATNEPLPDELEEINLANNELIFTPEDIAETEGPAFEETDQTETSEETDKTEE